MNFEFANPQWFAWVPLLIAIFALAALNEYLASRKLQKAFHSQLWLQLSQNISRGKRKFKWFCYFTASLLMLVALAQPRFGESEQQIERSGIEVMILADVSESMLAEDLKPSRLEQMKADLARLADLLIGHKIGIIAFAGSATLMCPLTVDPAAVKMYAESLSPLSVSTQGTSLVAALDLAKEAFARGGVDNRSRVILILSDGEDHEQGALDRAKQLASEQGIAIYTLAYGTEKGAAIPQRDSMGYLQNYKKDAQGKPVITTVKGDFLKSLAEAGQGQFYFAVPGGTQLQRLQQELDNFTKSEFAAASRKRYHERFQIPLFFAVLMFALGFSLSERKKRRKEVFQGRLI